MQYIINSDRSDAQLIAARYLERKQFAAENARRERWIITGMVVVGFCTAFLLSVAAQLIRQGV